MLTDTVDVPREERRPSIARLEAPMGPLNTAGETGLRKVICTCKTKEGCGSLYISTRRFPTTDTGDGQCQDIEIDAPSFRASHFTDWNSSSFYQL